MDLATCRDIPRIVGMVEALTAAVGGAQAIDRRHTARTLARLINSPDGAVWVTAGGFIAGAIAQTVISPDPVAVEHGWFAADRSGLRLLRAFETWATERGATRIILSTAPDGPDLTRLGYRRAELAWVK